MCSNIALFRVTFVTSLKLQCRAVSSMLFNHDLEIRPHNDFKIANRFTARYILFSTDSSNVCDFHCYKSSNSSIKGLKSKDYHSKNKIIQQMNFKCDEDARPFYNIPENYLLRILKITKLDESTGFCKNRLYFIADKIQCKPDVLSKALSKRLFVYSISAEWLAKTLQILQDMDVPGDRILKDLWVLKYDPDTIKQRLQLVKDKGVENLYPWMVRCTEDILYRSITISLDEKSILGDNNISTNHEYLAKRLNTTLDVVDDMCVKIPYLKYIRVTKIKSFLDFLLSEGFTEVDIIEKPRILASSLSTVKQRLTKLRSFGLKFINLNILCRSNKDFSKYCASLQTNYKKIYAN